MLPIAILAGGLASRLHPLTQGVPKALLPIAGRPFLFHQLDLLKRAGFRQVVLCLGHLAGPIRAAAGDGRAWDLSIRYSLDGPNPLGTGGALRQALPLLGDDFFVVYGDSYGECAFADIEAAYRAAALPALMAVLRNENRWDRSNVLFSHGRLLDYDKHAPRECMDHVDFGVSVLSRDAFKPYLGTRRFDLAELHRALALAGRLAAFEVRSRFYEIGSFEGLRATEAFLTDRSSAA